MGSEQARWSPKVSRDTDIALRTLLATRGCKKGDLSRFVEEAVNKEVLRETILELQTQNADISDAEIDELIETEMRATRAEFWTQHRA